MTGCDLRQIDTFALSLLNNPEVLNVNQNSTNNRQIIKDDKHVIWAADVPQSKDKYVAVFNLGRYRTRIKITFADIGIETNAVVRDLWSRTDIGSFDVKFEPILQSHGGGLYRIYPIE
jgi:hypothetical protein